MQSWKHVLKPNDEMVISLQITDFYTTIPFSYSVTNSNNNFGGLYVPVCWVSSLLKDGFCRGISFSRSQTT